MFLSLIRERAFEKEELWKLVGSATSRILRGDFQLKKGVCKEIFRTKSRQINKRGDMILT